jgi:hypothetical protein
MKIFIHTSGDSSVGLSGCTGTIDFPSIPDNIEAHFCQEREETRKVIAECFEKLLEEKCGILFDDECPDCGSKEYKNNECKYKSCPQNIPEEDYGE